MADEDNTQTLAEKMAYAETLRKAISAAKQQTNEQQSLTSEQRQSNKLDSETAKLERELKSAQKKADKTGTVLTGIAAMQFAHEAAKAAEAAATLQAAIDSLPSDAPGAVAPEDKSHEDVATTTESMDIQVIPAETLMPPVTTDAPGAPVDDVSTEVNS